MENKKKSLSELLRLDLPDAPVFVDGHLHELRGLHMEFTLGMDSFGTIEFTRVYASRPRVSGLCELAAILNHFERHPPTTQEQTLAHAKVCKLVDMLIESADAILRNQFTPK